MQKRIYVPEQHLFDENTEEFIHFKGGELVLVHSLVSIAKWEFKYHVPFLSSEKTAEQVIDYIRCMTVNQNVNPMLYLCLTEENIKDINEYINDPATATTFSDFSPEKKGGKKEILTNELIYYYMFILEIPKECEKWHINRLMALIHIFEIKQGDQKKMSKSDIYSRNRALNAARRAKHHSRG